MSSLGPSISPATPINRLPLAWCTNCATDAEGANGLRCGSFLRTINPGRPFRSVKDVLQVAGNNDLCFTEVWQYLSGINLCNLLQVAASRLNFCAGMAGEAEPQCLCQTRAGIDRGTASECQDDLPCSLLYGMPDHLAGSQCGCF